MSKVRTFSRYNSLATILLSKQIQLGRKRHKWSEQDLADRAGISRATLQKIEKGDLGCAIGLVFEVAALVNVQLFAADEKTLTQHIRHTDDKLALLPKSIRPANEDIDDDF